MARKPLLNINVPKVGRIQTKDVLRVGVIGLGLVTLWYRGDQIPVIGSYVHRAKHFIGSVTGIPVTG